MAYSLGDPYRPLRVLMRTNGVLLGLGMGMGLSLGTPALLRSLGYYSEGPLLPLRLAGVTLIALGLFLIGAAGRYPIERSTLIPCIVFHALLAVTLLLGYLRNEIVIGNLFALIVLLGAFLLCLPGALVPLRYFGAEYGP